jgi:anti-sigma B factor antagonist
MGVKDQLSIEVRTESDRVIVALAGELDMASAASLQSTVEGDQLAARETVVLDLEQLGFIDSTGLRIILLARERCRERGQEFAVTRGSQQVQRLLSVTGVDEHLRTIDDAGEVLVEP